MVFSTLISGVDPGRGLWLLVCSAGWLSAFTSAFRSAERWPLGVQPSWWWVRCRAGSNGDGVASPGDTGDIMGALTGRVDLLSGVEAMAAVDRQKKQCRPSVFIYGFGLMNWIGNTAIFIHGSPILVAHKYLDSWWLSYFRARCV